MTYEEAIKKRTEIHKDSIKERLYKIDPIKYKKFKVSKTGTIISLREICEIWDMVSTINKHEHGDLFESKGFYNRIKKNGI